MQQYILIVDWEDEARSALDHDSPFCFGPYEGSEYAEAAKRDILGQSEQLPEPDRLTCRVLPLLAPRALAGFLST